VTKLNGRVTEPNGRGTFYRLLLAIKLLKSHSRFSGPMITVLVGPLHKEFKVHRDIICVESKYFAAACSEHWLAKDGVVKLPEDEPAIFELVLKFLYSDSLPDDVLIEYLTFTAISAELRLYVLADKLQYTSLLQRLDEAFSRLVYGGPENDEPNTVLKANEVQYVYENTPSSSGLRKTVAHSVAVALANKMTTVHEVHELCISMPELGTDLITELTYGVESAFAITGWSIRW